MLQEPARLFRGTREGHICPLDLLQQITSILSSLNGVNRRSWWQSEMCVCVKSLPYKNRWGLATSQHGV